MFRFCEVDKRAASRLSLLNNNSELDMDQLAPPEISGHSQIDPILTPHHEPQLTRPMVDFEANTGSSRRMDKEVDAKGLSVHYPSEIGVRRTDRQSNVEEEHTIRASSVADTDEDEFEEAYDWSTDDDLLDKEAKFEHTVTGEQPRKGWGPKR